MKTPHTRARGTSSLTHVEALLLAHLPKAEAGDTLLLYFAVWSAAHASGKRGTAITHQGPGTLVHAFSLPGEPWNSPVIYLIFAGPCLRALMPLSWSAPTPAYTFGRTAHVELIHNRGGRQKARHTAEEV